MGSNTEFLKMCETLNSAQEPLEHSASQRIVDYYNNYSNLIYSTELKSIVTATKQIQYQLWFGTNGVVLYTDGTGGSVTRTYDEYLADTLQYSISQVTNELDQINRDIEEMYAIICLNTPTERSIKTYISELWTIIKDSIRSVFEWIAQFIP